MHGSLSLFLSTPASALSSPPPGSLPRKPLFQRSSHGTHSGEPRLTQVPSQWLHPTSDTFYDPPLSTPLPLIRSQSRISLQAFLPWATSWPCQRPGSRHPRWWSATTVPFGFIGPSACVCTPCSADEETEAGGLWR